MIRLDLDMTPGKIASQTGHAYVEAIKQEGQHCAAYLEEEPGTKICLGAKSESDLRKAADWLKQNGIPHSIITDSGHVAFFEGVPTVTALGFGPCLRHEVKALTKKFKLLP